MNFKEVKSVLIPDGEVKKIAINGTRLWEQTLAKNWVKFSTENDGVTIFNDGLGYKTGFRISSSGTEKEASNGLITGFIPFDLNEVMQISPAFTKTNLVNVISYYSENFTHLGYYQDAGYGGFICDGHSFYGASTANGISTLSYTPEFDSRIKYVRITHSLSSTDGTNFIITKKE